LGEWEILFCGQLLPLISAVAARIRF
jgi:hypothetical protein